MANINILDKKHCTGCSLCANICPKNAISLIPDEEGFYAPTVNDSCIDCSLCAKKCPQLSKSFSYEGEKVAYAIWADDKTREKGSSGGVFPLIAEKTVSEGGVVYGAAFDQSPRKLRHIEVTSKENLPFLFKSKYVQSEMGTALKDAKQRLQEGKNVVFSGCPCQIDALKAYLGKDYDNLFTIDILCHGVPSPMAYNRFLDEISDGKEVTAVDFRDKKWGWGTLIRVDFNDDTSKYSYYNEAYFNAFLQGYNMRNGCYNCKYACPERVGDITIGDFWGAEKYDESWNDKKGTSLVMCNTKKGAKLIQSLKKNFARIEELDYDKMLEISKRANGAIVRPTTKPFLRDVFFRHIKMGDSFTRSLSYAQQARMDVGILGWWIETPYSNYGSTLTDYALYRYLTDKGLSVAMVSPPGFDRAYAGVFNKKYRYRMTANYSKADMKENNKYIDSFVVASDVLWYYDAFIRQGFNFLLDFVDDSKRKISYSTSFGNTVKFFPDSEMPYAKYLMQRFDHVSVREVDGVKICKERFEVDATQVLDPVFICDMKNWEEIEKNATRKPEEEYIFSYMLDPTPEKAHALEKLGKRLGYKVISITDKQVNHDEKVKILKHCGIIEDASIEDFIYHIKNARFVLTDSFHGFCFSLIFNRPMIALVNRQRGGARFDSLAGQIGVKDRMVESVDELKSLKAEFLLNLDYENINKALAKEIERSQKWLDNAMFSERKPKVIDWRTILGKELYQANKRIESLEKRIAQLEAKK